MNTRRFPRSFRLFLQVQMDIIFGEAVKDEDMKIQEMSEKFGYGRVYTPMTLNSVDVIFWGVNSDLQLF